MNDRPSERKNENPSRDAPDQPLGGGVEEMDLAVVAGIFTAKSGAEEALAYALSRYVVLSRMEPGCRNIDLVSSVTVPGLLMVWEKWESHDHRKAHFAGKATADMADAVADLVREPPQFDIFDAVSAHDLA